MKVNYSNYKQISDDLENKILTGSFSPGQKIPSIHILAAKYQVNANTVQRAIFKLKQTKLMISVIGTGIFVTTHAELIHQYRKAKIKSLVYSYITQMKSIGFSDEQIENIIIQEYDT